MNLQNNKRLVKNFSQLEDLNEHGRNVVVIKETVHILLESRKRHRRLAILFILLESDLRISKPGLSKFLFDKFT